MKWSEVKYDAALLVAQDRLANAEIAKQCEITTRGLDKWKADPEFQAEVRRHLQAWRDRVFAKGIANEERRILSLDNRWRRCQTIIEERSRDPKMQDVPGGRTGLLRHRRKMIGSGGHAEVCDEYAVDVGLLKEMRKLEAQAAAELGQWERDRHAPREPVVLVVSPGQNGAAASAGPVSEAVAPALPGVVIDLGPESR